MGARGGAISNRDHADTSFIRKNVDQVNHHDTESKPVAVGPTPLQPETSRASIFS